jgi:hypothetical protein
MRRILAGAACLALLVLVVTPFATDAKKRSSAHKLVFATRDGPDVTIGPLSTNDVGSYIVRCRRGWQATGFGVLLGANDLVYADPTTDGRGYEFLFGNPDSSNAFTSSGNVRCAKGKNGLRVKAALSSGARRTAAHDWQAGHG